MSANIRLTTPVGVTALTDYRTSSLTSRQVRIIGVASGCGAPDPGCADGPETLRRGELLTRLWRGGLEPYWDSTVTNRTDSDGLAGVQEVCAALAERVCKTVRDGALPFVVGGDHSCAIGTWRGVAEALRARGRLGLIWIDAHMDAHSPLSSPSGALHGMPLACLLGFGDSGLIDASGGPALLPQHVCLVGVRSFEAEECALLERLGVRVFSMDEIEQRGIADVLREAHAIVSQGTAGFGITLDIDALDPADAPGVGTPEPGGLRAAALAHALTTLQRGPAPHRDRDCRVQPA